MDLSRSGICPDKLQIHTRIKCCCSYGQSGLENACEHTKTAPSLPKNKMLCVANPISRLLGLNQHRPLTRRVLCPLS